VQSKRSTYYELNQTQTQTVLKLGRGRRLGRCFVSP